MLLTEFVEEVQKNLDIELSREKIRKVIVATGKTIMQVLAKDDSVLLYGFGKFSVKYMKPHFGRNRMTGNLVKVGVSAIPRFYPAKKFRKLLKTVLTTKARNDTL